MITVTSSKGRWISAKGIKWQSIALKALARVLIYLVYFTLQGSDRWSFSLQIADFGITKLLQRLRQQCTGHEGCYCKYRHMYLNPCTAELISVAPFTNMD